MIELLVVIAVIVILAALLLPAFRTAMESAHTTRCVGNLKQIGAGMFLFAQDHSNCFPQSGAPIPWGSVDPSTGLASWMQQLTPYLANSNDPALSTSGSIFTCPSSSRVTGSYAFDKYYSYFNGAHAAYAAQGAAAPVRKSLISKPAAQILSGDITDWPAGAGGTTDADKVDYTQNPIDLQSNFHNGRVNILFADGHVVTAGWQTNSLSVGYFDPTTMATHYPGIINPQSNTYYTSYLTP